MLRDKTFKLEKANLSDLPDCLNFEEFDEAVTDNELVHSLCVASGIENGNVYLYRGNLLGQERILAYVRIEFVTPSCIPFVSWWYVVPHLRKYGVADMIINDVKKELASQGFDFLVFSHCKRKLSEKFVSRGMFHIGNLDIELKDGYLCERFYAEFFDRASLSDKINFLIEKIKFKTRYFLGMF